VVTNAAYTLAQAINDWLADGLVGRAPKTISTQREVIEPLIGIIGAVPLCELTATTVRSALKELAATRATRTVGMAHAGLTRAIRHAEANDNVRRSVATLVDTPVAREGRPSKSLTFGQAVALIRAAQSYGLYAYVVLSLLVGVRTEEARAVRWDHVDLDGNPDAEPPVPPHVDVWRSVRAHGDTETKKSRRSLGLPKMAVEVLREHLQRQADARLRAGVLWQDNGLARWMRSGPDAEAAVGHLHLVYVERPGRRAAEDGAGGDVELRAVALAHDRPPGEQSCGQRARGAGAGAEIVERVQLAAGPGDGDPQLAVAEVERDDKPISDRVARPDRAEGISSELGHWLCSLSSDPVQ
jgi:integrase